MQHSDWWPNLDTDPWTVLNRFELRAHLELICLKIQLSLIENMYKMVRLEKAHKINIEFAL